MRMLKGKSNNMTNFEFDFFFVRFKNQTDEVAVKGYFIL